MFSEAAARGVNLTIDQTTQIITGPARRSPPSGAGWHDRYGHGRISACNAVKAVIDLSNGGATSSAAATSSKARKLRKRKP